MLVHSQMRLAFERSLELAKKAGYVRNSKPVRLAMDTSQILGRGAVKDTYNLISEGIRQVLRALARVKKQKPQDYARSQGLGRHFGSSIKGESEVAWEDEDSRSRFLAELVAEAHRALRLACEVRNELEAGSRRSSGSRPAASSWPPSCSRIWRSSGRRMGARRRWRSRSRPAGSGSAALAIRRCDTGGRAPASASTATSWTSRPR